MMLLSIIIPIYNIENYIRECLDSIIKIKNIDYEILAILGKSTDNTNEIVEEYALNHKNIKVHFQNEKGLSNARNCGLMKANGKYVFFCDGDDFIIHKKFEDAILFLDKNKGDFLVSEYMGIYDGTSKKYFSNQMTDLKECDDFDKNIYKFLNRKKSFWNVWRYIYKRDFLIKNNMYFKEGIYSEDLDYTTMVFLSTNNIYFYPDIYYCYRLERNNSLMNIVTFNRVNDTANVIENSINTLYLKNYKYKLLFYKQYIFEFVLNIEQIMEVRKEDRNELKKIFKDKMKLLVLDKYFFSNSVYFFIKIFGIYVFVYIMFILKKVKRLLKGKKI